MQHFQNGGNPIWLPKNRGTNRVNKALVSVSILLLNLSTRTDNKFTKYTKRLENKPIEIWKKEYSLLHYNRGGHTYGILETFPRVYIYIK